MFKIVCVLFINEKCCNYKNDRRLENVVIHNIKKKGGGGVES